MSFSRDFEESVTIAAIFLFPLEERIVVVNPNISHVRPVRRHPGSAGRGMKIDETSPHRPTWRITWILLLDL